MEYKESGEADWPVTWSRPDLSDTVTKGRSSGINICNNYGLINIVEYIFTFFPHGSTALVKIGLFYEVP